MEDQTFHDWSKVDWWFLTPALAVFQLYHGVLVLGTCKSTNVLDISLYDRCTLLMTFSFQATS